jgi:signal transduction histidine kinase
MTEASSGDVDGLRAAHERDDSPAVAVVLSHDRNRELLCEWLSPSYELVVPDPGESSLPPAAAAADLLFLDAGAYARHPDWVAAYRDSEDALFHPVLLLVSGDGDVEPSVWADVDDVVSTPVAKAVLRARVEGLLSRRALTRDVAASEQRFRTLFEASPDPVLVVSGEGPTVVDANEGFRDRFVGSDEPCRGRPLASFDAFDSGAVATLTSAPDGGDRPVISARTRADESRYVECSRRRLPASASASAGDRQVVVLRDVTDRVHRERQLERQLDRLDEFAGVLAHEIRNPLGIASGWLERARATGDGDAFDRVERAHDRLAGMVDELLELARQGHIVGDVSTVSVASLVTEAWDAVPSSDGTLALDPPLSDCTVTGDRGRLREVFVNLFRNALEHGGPEVTVSVGLLDDETGLYVADDGAGFDECDVDHLFEPGYTTDAGGTGFGLAIVEQVVEAHGWAVSATEGPAGGARFELIDVALSCGPGEGAPEGT